MRVQSADDLIAPAVADTIDKLTLQPEDHAATRLARSYAKAIDESNAAEAVLEKLGPKLLTVLESLGATPQARAQIHRVMKGATTGPPSRLQLMREARGS